MSESQRIAQLEAEIERLRADNRALRKDYETFCVLVHRLRRKLEEVSIPQ